jgi:twitching motility protein PilT
MMQTGSDKYGMQTLNQSLANLYQRRSITIETAMSISSNIEELKDLIERKSSNYKRGETAPRVNLPRMNNPFSQGS